MNQTKPNGQCPQQVQGRAFPLIKVNRDFYHFSLTCRKAALLRVSFALIALPLALISSSYHPHADPISSPHDLSPREISSTQCIWQMTAPHPPATNRRARRGACCWPTKPLVRLGLQTQNFWARRSPYFCSVPSLGVFPTDLQGMVSGSVGQEARH